MFTKQRRKIIMNKQESDILTALLEEPYINQRILSELSGHSLGIVNRSLKKLIEAGYIDNRINLTEKAYSEFSDKAPKNAIILAAGYGMRMVPINTEYPKGLLEINGEPLIERTIKHLHRVDINEIYIVVGFMKEKYEYLIDEYGVELVVNEEYATKNNLYSLSLVLEHLSNSYIIPCDVWCEINPFSRNELYSWYMVSDVIDNESSVRVNRKRELVIVSEQSAGNSMIGIAYIAENEAEILRNKIAEMIKNIKYDDSFWEESLYNKGKMLVKAKVVFASGVVEINTFEQLRELDSASAQLRSDALSVIGKTFNVNVNDIVNINVLKKGMTNRSFLFSCNDKKYIMRIPGEGTDKLINRREEATVYKLINKLGICDNVIYIDPQSGYKITEYIEGVRACDPFNKDDLKKCMDKLRQFHRLGIKTDYEFNIFSQIDFYESLWEGKGSVYKDYKKTKENVLSLKPYIDTHVERYVLTHIDAVPDNFLFYKTENGTEQIYLIDWEYAGMQDPHVDIAMFCIYAMYNKRQVDRLIDIYFEGTCTVEMRIKIYCYIAVGGLLWSNWCEYKKMLGVEFGEYSLRQYRYAKDYYKIALEEMKKAGDENE